MEVKYYKKIFLTPGIVSYKDKNEGVLLIQKETIDNALDTIKNKDVVITHNSTNKVGTIVDAYYDTIEGAYVCGLNIFDKTATELLDKENYSISCFYNILEEGGGGIYHNIKYDTEAKNIEFVNIAIVETPRYQEARKVINSINNDGEEMSIINKIKNSLTKEDNKAKEEVKDVDTKKDEEGEEVENSNSQVPSKYHQSDSNDMKALLEMIARKLGCFEQKNESDNEEDEATEVDDDEEEYESEEEEVKNEVKPIKKEPEQDKQDESKFEKYTKEKKVKRPIANSINNAVNSYNEPFEYKNRKDRIKESNKKFYNND